MQLEQFLRCLTHLTECIHAQTEKIENNTKQGIETMPELLALLEELLPDWFFFIEQTGIGEQEAILQILAETQKGITMGDGVFLADVLLNGLGALAEEYIRVIEEALDGE